MACPDLNTRGGLAPSCIGVRMAHVVRRKFLNYYLFIRGVVDVATYVTYIMVYYWWCCSRSSWVYWFNVLTTGGAWAPPGPPLNTPVAIADQQDEFISGKVCLSWDTLQILRWRLGQPEKCPLIIFYIHCMWKCAYCIHTIITMKSICGFRLKCTFVIRLVNTCFSGTFFFFLTCDIS